MAGVAHTSPAAAGSALGARATSFCAPKYRTLARRQIERELESLPTDTAGIERRIQRIAQLADPAISDPESIRTLLPIARGVSGISAEWSAQREMVAAQDAINAIVATHGSHPPRRALSIGPTAPGDLKLLRYESIDRIEPMSRDGQTFWNDLYVVHFKNGEQGILKPVSGQVMFREPPPPEGRGIRPGTARFASAFNREEASSLLIEEFLGGREARALGASPVFVPETLNVGIRHRGVTYGLGSLARKEPGVVTLQEINRDPVLKDLPRTTARSG